jgi:Tol biopolymer transport system component
MTVRRIALRAVLGGIVMTGILACLSCREEGLEEEPTAMLQTSPAVFEPAIEISGRIVFQSDLDGDDDIYLLQGRRITRLTDNDWDDRYPRWSPDGTKIAYLANPEGKFDLFIMEEPGGLITRVSDSPDEETDLSWTPDGRGIAFSVETGGTLRKRRSIWLGDLASGKKERLVPGFSGSHQLPDLTSRLSRIAFTGKKGAGWDVFLTSLESPGVIELTRGGKSCRPRFSPDGERIAYVSHEADGKGDIWTMDEDGSHPRRLTLRDDAYDYFPSWSPDGARIVFCSNLKDKYADKGEWGLYLVDLADGRVTLLFDSPGKDVFPDWH